MARTTALAFQAQLACRGRGTNRALHGPEHRAHGAHLADHARGSGCIRAGQPSARRRGVRRRLLRRPGGSIPRARGRREPAPRQHAREARKAPARVSHAWERHLDRRQLDPDDRRGGSRAARERGVGAHPRPAGAGVAHVRQGGGCRFRPRRGAPDGARLRRATDAGRCAARALGLRFLRDPRGLRRAGPVHAQGVGIARVLARQARPRRTARGDRSGETQRQRQQPRCRASVCRYRRAYCRDARQAARRARPRSRSDFDLHGGWYGRNRDPRALKARDESRLRRAHGSETAAIAALYSAANQTSPGIQMPRAIVVMTAAVLLAGCATESPTPPAAQAPPAAAPVAGAHAELATLLDRYFEELLELNPLLATFIGDNRYNDRLPNDIGPEQRARQHELNERYLAAARRIDANALDGPDRISLEIFLRERARALESERFPDYLIPIDQTGGLQATMPALGSGTNAQPFATVEDYDKWLVRLDGFIVWIDQAIVNMREGMQKGVVQPRPVMAKVLPQLDAMIVDDPTKSDYYGPIRNLPAGFGAADRERLTAAYTSEIHDKLVPAYRRLRTFVHDEYLPRARTSVAWTALPDGGDWYRFLVAEHTTTTMTPEEIHQLGLSEVARILGRMDEVRQTVGFQGELPAFFAYLRSDPKFYYTRGADLVAGYVDVKKRIDAALPRLFSLMPKADYEVREVEAFRAKSAAGASYQQASADGSRPGIFYVNTYDLKSQPRFGMETLSLHEASPGHHFQISIQQELTGLPRFRRFGGDYTAYVEGWALYAEYLGPELGLFTDPYQAFGRLNDEQLRAMRLVVDTGLHAKGWSREQAIEYMIANSTLAPSDVESEVERYIAWPGQALGYKVGDLRIQALRRKAEASLGEKFDIRAFHREVLSDGAVPMEILERKIDRWIEALR